MKTVQECSAFESSRNRFLRGRLLVTVLYVPANVFTACFSEQARNTNKKNKQKSKKALSRVDQCRNIDECLFRGATRHYRYTTTLPGVQKKISKREEPWQNEIALRARYSRSFLCLLEAVAFRPPSAFVATREKRTLRAQHTT